jgi:diguanylate cyclase (GGDEF)-like protein
VSTDAATEPSGSAPAERDATADPPGNTAATWARAFFTHPSRVAAFLWAAGAAAVALVLPLRAWPTTAFSVLVAVAALAGASSALRLALGPRLPVWSLNVDVAVGNLLVTVAAGAALSRHVNLANLYLLIVVFSLLYLPLRAALGHLAAAGAAYAVVLSVGPRPAQPAVVAWLAVFGAAVVVGAVILGLVSVLRVSAREDHLTGLANRRHWDERLDQELERARRSHQPLSVIVADLDGFKVLNDTFGHPAGDRLLCELASKWRTVMRTSGDLLARTGGDEFAVLAPETDQTGIHRLARRLAETLPQGVSASIGTATWDRSENASDLLRRADRAMYHNKRRRRRDPTPRPA